MLLLLCACLPLATLSSHPRQTFSDKLVSLGIGQTKNEVLKQLGKPDVVYSGANPAPFSAAPVREMWGYGVDAKGSLPTLALVPFDKTNLSTIFYRSREFPWAKVPEDQIRKTMRIWQKWWIYEYDEFSNASAPVAAIKIANELRPSGKDAILAGLEELCVAYSDQCWNLMDRHIAILRLLFDLDEGAVKANGDPETERALGFLRNTIVYEGIPFTFFLGGGGSGIPPTAALTIPVYEKYGKLREKIAIPTLDPVGWPERFASSPEYRAAITGLGLEPSQARMQALQKTARDMLVSLLPYSLDELQRNAVWDDVWKSVESLKNTNLQWDSKRNIYVDTQGKYLDDCALTPVIARTCAPPELAAEGAYFVFRRVSKRAVLLTFLGSTAQKPTPFLAHIVGVEGQNSFDITVDEGGLDAMVSRGEVTVQHRDNSTRVLWVGPAASIKVLVSINKATPKTYPVSFD